jgi:hypothetical protein
VTARERDRAIVEILRAALQRVIEIGDQPVIAVALQAIDLADEVELAPQPYQYNGYLSPYLDDILRQLRAGETAQRVADGLPAELQYTSLGMIRYLARRYGIATLQKPPPHTRAERNAEMVRRYRDEKLTCAVLAREYGISAARATQIIRRAKQREQHDGNRYYG